MSRFKSRKWLFVPLLLALNTKAWSQDCEIEADLGSFLNNIPPSIEGLVTIFPGAPSSLAFSTTADGPILIEDVTNDGDGDSVLRLFSINAADGSVSLIEENDDGGLGLRARIARASEPRGEYCIDVREFNFGFIDVELVIQTGSQTNDDLPQCLQTEIATFGYYEGRVPVSSGSNSGRFDAIGTVRFETDGTLALNGNGVDVQVHELNDPGGAVDLSIARSVSAGATYCVYQRDGNFNEIEFQPSENIYESGFVQYPPGEVRFPEGGGAGQLTISLQSAITLPVAIDWQVDFNSDSSAADFTDSNFLGSFDSIVIEPGETTAAITIPINDDSAEETSELTNISFFDPNSTVFGSVASSTFIIEDDDAPIVTQTNSPPQFTTTISQINGEVNLALSQLITASDPNNDPLSFTLNGPAWLSLTEGSDRRSATISGVPSSSGGFNVSVIADDGRGGTATLGFTVQVADDSTDPVVPVVPETSVADSGGGGGNLNYSFTLLLVFLGLVVRRRRTTTRAIVN